MSKRIKRRQFLAGVAAAGPAIGLISADRKGGRANRARIQRSAGAAGRAVAQRHAAADAGQERARISWSMSSRRSISTTAHPCPGSTFRGLHESMITYGNNQKPEFITTPARRYRGRDVPRLCQGRDVNPWPAWCMAPSACSTRRMAIYNAFADRVPMLVLSGNIGNSATRQMIVNGITAAQDQAITVRDFTKWDDQPASLQGFADSMVRAYDLMTTVPMAPVLITADGDLQEDTIPPGMEKKLYIPKLKRRSHPAGDPAAGARRREDAGRGGKSGHLRQPLCAHGERPGAAGRVGRIAAGAGGGQSRPHEYARTGIR